MGLVIGAGGLGVATAGLAAPAIGAAIGSAMGLSGAAAVNAGLAALGGGAISAGGLGVAGGTALIGGMGGLVGSGGAAAASAFVKSNDVTPEMVELEARKLEALHDRLAHHAQTSQAYAQQVIVELRARIRDLETENARLRRRSADHEDEIALLERKLNILEAALERMLAEDE